MLIPAGPMRSGIPNKEKARVRQLYAEGKVGRDELLESEARSYHEPGTCTFYGTANSNQMMAEVMGLMQPNAAFINPGTPLRQALTRAGIHRLVEIGGKKNHRPLGLCVDEKSIVNAVVGLLATGGSTNHAIHLPAIARAAGIVIDWTDFDRLSAVVPLIAKVYPNGSADVNNFHDAGGMAFTIKTLLDAGLLHEDIKTVSGEGLRAYGSEARIEGEALHYDPAPAQSRDVAILRAASDPFAPDGGMRVVEGGLGRGVFKTSAVDKKYWTIEAPCRVFDDQKAVNDAFKAGELDRDVVVVVRFQGPHANGMPELHQLTPALGVVLDRGHKVALVTDGRMSGASGKVPAAIHVYPEAAQGGPLAKVRDGDIVRLCAERGELTILADDFESRTPAPKPPEAWGMGRELFAFMRQGADSAERGASAMLAAGLPLEDAK
jgi:phosphogluconate dehydratase